MLSYKQKTQAKINAVGSKNTCKTFILNTNFLFKIA